MKDISFPRVLIAAIFCTVIAQVIHTLGSFLDMKYYFIPDYFAVWSRSLDGNRDIKSSQINLFFILWHRSKSLQYPEVLNPIKPLWFTM